VRTQKCKIGENTNNLECDLFPASLPLSHYACYDLQVTTAALTANLRDQFQNDDFQIANVRRLCNPVVKKHMLPDGTVFESEIMDESNHLRVNIFLSSRNI